MHPILFRIGPVVIYSYGVMVAIGFCLALLLLQRQAQKEGISQDLVTNLAYLVLFAGITGARLLYVVLNFSYYRINPLEIFLIFKGGLVWYGGLVFGTLTGIFYVRKHGLPVYRVLDLFAPYLALGQSIGRLGCFLNGCCYGKESPWGIYFPVHGRHLIPTQLFSSTFLLALFLGLRFLQKRPHPAGRIFVRYLLLYVLWRFFIEFLRGDSPTVLAGLTIFQWMSLFLAAVALLLAKSH